MRNLINTKRRTFWNTGLYTLLHAIGIYFAFILLILFWLSRAADAEAVEFEISAGHTVFNQSEQGTWWQNGQDHHFYNESNSLTIGITDYATDSIRYHVGYNNLGSISSWAIATSDADYNGQGCISNPCKETDVYIGNGHVEGVYFTLAPEIQWGEVKLFIEGGFWIYQASFHMTVISQKTGPNVMGWDREKDNALQIGPVIGLGIEYKKLQILVSAWKIDSVGEDSNTIPNYQGYASNISIRKIF